MARQNIDEEFWSDPRLDKLAEGFSRAEAIGSCVILWRTGQMYWKKGKQLIPRAVFEAIPNHERLLNASFASVRNEEIYVHGALERWSYLTGEQQSAAGKKSAEMRKRKYGSAKPVNADRTDTERPSANSNHTHTPPHTPQKNINGDVVTLALLWNESCGSLPRLRAPENLDPKRAGLAHAALRAAPDLSLWREAIMRMAASDFCQGKQSTGAHRNWKADFKFLVKPGNIDQILEGGFGCKSLSSGNSEMSYAARMEAQDG